MNSPIYADHLGIENLFPEDASSGVGGFFPSGKPAADSVPDFSGTEKDVFIEGTEGAESGDSKLSADEFAAILDWSGLDDVLTGAATPSVSENSGVFDRPSNFPALLREDVELLSEAVSDSARKIVDLATVPQEAVSNPIAVSENSPAPAIPETPETPETPEPSDPRQERLTAFKSSLFHILSENPDFPPYHAKMLLDLAGNLVAGDPAEEMARMGDVMLYFIDTLGVFFDPEIQWAEKKEAYVHFAAERARFESGRLSAIATKLGVRKGPSPEEIESQARASYMRDYESSRKRTKRLLEDF